MNAATLHLTVAHVPAVGCLITVVLLGVAVARGSRELLLVSCGMLVASAVLATVAHSTGPPAYEEVRVLLDPGHRERVEAHAVLGRASFVSMVAVGALALQGLLRAAAGEPTAAWLRWTLLAAAVAMFLLLAWTSHLGGAIHHPEVRGVTLTLATGA